MSRFLDRASVNPTYGIARTVQYWPNGGRRLSQAAQPAMATSWPRNIYRPNEVGRPVDTRDIPDFWKPIEEWAVD